MRQGYKGDTIIYEGDEIILERLAKPGYVSRKKIIELMREARKDQAERIKSQLIYALQQEGLIQGKAEKVECIKPTHGNCCTCQKCGQAHDECVCTHNEWIDFLNGSNFDFTPKSP